MDFAGNVNYKDQVQACSEDATNTLNKHDDTSVQPNPMLVQVAEVLPHQDVESSVYDVDVEQLLRENDRLRMQNASNENSDEWRSKTGESAKGQRRCCLHLGLGLVLCLVLVLAVFVASASTAIVLSSQQQPQSGTEAPNTTISNEQSSGDDDPRFCVGYPRSTTKEIMVLPAGRLPSCLHRLTDLKVLFVRNNKLTGTLPTELALLTKLVRLDLTGNSLTGTVPPELFRGATSLKILRLDRNKFTGPLPFDMGTSLTQLRLAANHLTGPIDPVTQLSKLVWLHLYNNRFTGTLPTEIGTLTQLQEMSVGNNNAMEGTLPTEIGALTNLRGLWLYQNQFTGTLPDYAPLLDNLTIFEVNDNDLTGSVPEWIDRIPSVKLSGNRLAVNASSVEVEP